MEEITLKIEELLNKLNRNELIQLNRAILRRVKIMDDLKRFKDHSAFYRRVFATLLTKLAD